MKDHMKDHSDHDHENLCWLDLETTGLNPSVDAILEIGITITTKTLKHVASQAWVVIPSKDISILGIDPVVWRMHRLTHLWTEAFESEMTLGQAANHAARFIIDSKAQGSPLCGNNIGFDRGFLKEQAPELLHVLHYRNIDVSTLKNVFAMHYPDFKYTKPCTIHRALNDLDMSIDEYRFYLNMIRSGDCKL